MVIVTPLGKKGRVLRNIYSLELNLRYKLIAQSVSQRRYITRAADALFLCGSWASCFYCRSTQLCTCWGHCVLLPVISWLCRHIGWVPTDVGPSPLPVWRHGTLYRNSCVILFTPPPSLKTFLFSEC